MINLPFLSMLKSFFLVLILLVAIVFQAQAKVSTISSKGNIVANSISGIVFDNRRNALPDVDVELLDDLYRFVSRTRTDPTGRYFFSGMGQGRYKIRAFPLLLDFEEAVVDVEIVNFQLRNDRNLSSDSIIQDIFLRPRRGGLNDDEMTGTIFVQNTPKDAERLYVKALEDFKGKRVEEGIKNLQAAVSIFPEYYSALERLGNEFFKLKQYEIAAQAFLKAGEVNRKSAIAYYMLGYSFYMLKNYKAANIALRQALTITPASPRVLLMLGTSLRLNNEYEESEKQLKQAKKLAEGNLPDINMQLALLYGNNLKRYKEAADELEIYLKARPDGENTKFIKELIKKFKEKIAKS